MKLQNKRYLGIRDIAKIAGVSTASVSRVINSPEKTSKSMKKRVNSVIKEYNYVPNQMAKNLFSQNSNSIAFFTYSLDNPFFSSLIRELNNIAFKNGYALLICDTQNNLEKEKEYLRYCESIRCGSIIFTEGINHKLSSCVNKNQNIVYLDRYSDSNCSSVSSDNAKGIKMLIDYLYSLNHKKIGFAGLMNHFQSSIDRKNSYIKTLKSYNIEINKEYIFNGTFSYQTGVEAFEYFYSLNEAPTAIVCANDQIAQGLIITAKKQNVSVPDDLSVVGFDGINIEYFHPKLTTIKQNINKIAQTLFHRATNKDSIIGHDLIDISLEIGDSCKKIE